MKTLNKYHKGFTLIELLVVISIISLLSSVVLASLKGAREKAILTKTVAEMKSLQVAVELYKSQFGVYPGGGVSYIDKYPPSSTELPGSLQLESFENTFLISNKFLTKPILAPTFEACDTECVNKGYELHYRNVSSATYFFFKCGDEFANNYIIFLLANTKKLNLPLAGIAERYSATLDYKDLNYTYNAGAPGTAKLKTSSPYTYCLAG